MCNLDMHKLFFNLKESQLFQYLVIGIIIFNAFTIGITTYELSTFTKNIINLLDYFITIFFLVEIKALANPL